MEIIFGYIKNIVYFTLFIDLILIFFPNKNYVKYIKFIAGILLVLVAVEPFVNFDKIQKEIEMSFHKYSLEIVNEEITENLNEMETKILNRVLEQEQNGY